MASDQKPARFAYQLPEPSSPSVLFLFSVISLFLTGFTFKSKEAKEEAEQVKEEAEQVKHEAEQVKHEAEQVKHEAEQVKEEAEQVNEVVAMQRYARQNSTPTTNLPMKQEKNPPAGSSFGRETNLRVKREGSAPLVRTVSSQKSLDKRKATNPEEDSSSMHLVARQKKRQLSNTESKAPGSKKVKIYDLRGLDDHLQSGLDIIFCGISPGLKSSQTGHHYANPTNQFWSCLHQSGLTPRRLDPREDSTLSEEFSIGLTTLVSQPTIEKKKPSKAEQIIGVSELMQKITQHRPRITCFVGLGIAAVVKSVVTGKCPKSTTVVGLQPYKAMNPDGNPSETLFYAVSSTSGLVVQYQSETNQ